MRAARLVMARRALLLAAILFMGLAVPAMAHDRPVIAAPAGQVRGTLQDGVRVFRGLPYAQPPVGALRWRPPQAPAPWSGVRDAADFGAACMQPASPFSTHAAVSEDCLFLNIWTPQQARGAPVLVWIHGGSLVSGSGAEAVYDGARLARQGVIVVSINYRLGALGWMAHPALSAESAEHVSGNYGLMDQVQALRWVRDNIGAFGGDPRRVTIAGQSAGALSVLYLMAAPEARGLFDGAISQSGYMIAMPELRDGHFTDWPDAESLGAALAERLGAPDLAALRALPAQDIVSGAAGGGYFPLGTIDGAWLPRQLVDVFDRGEQARVPLLTGYNAGEIRSLPILLPPAPEDADAYVHEIRTRYGDLSDAFLALYPASDIRESMMATTRDAMYGWTAERLARTQRAAGAPAFLYLFDHGYPAADEAGFHAFHGAELPYVFGTSGSLPAWWPAIPDTASERRLSDAIQKYWVAFVRDGRPQAHGEPSWPLYDSDRAYMAFEAAPEPRTGPPNGYALNEAVVCRRRADGRQAWHWNVGVIAPHLPPPASACD